MLVTVNCSGTVISPGLLYGAVSGTIIWRLTISTYFNLYCCAIPAETNAE